MLEIYGSHIIRCDHPDCDSTFLDHTYTGAVVNNAYTSGYKLGLDGYHWFCKDHAPDDCFKTVKEAIERTIS